MKKRTALLPAGIFAALLLALLASPAMAATTSANGILDVSILTYQPVPAQPGDRVDVWIQVSNNGTTASNRGTLTIVESYPFIAESSRDAVKEFPSIPAQNSFLVKTSLRIDRNAHEGDNYLNVRVQQTGAAGAIERSLPITIRGRTGALSVINATTTPAVLAPGGTAQLLLRVRNIGDTPLRNVGATLGLGGLAVAPTGTSNTQMIDALDGGEEAAFIFALTAYPDAAVHAYQVPVNFSYEDVQGTARSQQEMIGLVIGAAPELMVYFESAEVYKETGEGDVIVKVVNRGLSQVKLLQLEVLENDDIQVASESPKVYIGNIDADDYESADLRLRTRMDSVEVPLRLTYRDALNREHADEVSLRLARKSRNGGGTPGWLIGLIVLIALGGGVFWWRRRRARRRPGK